jgi:hypothetical protein
VADAVTVEPVSASEFPANREKNREFCQFRASVVDGPELLGRKINGFLPNSLRSRTGNFLAISGIVIGRTGNLGIAFAASITSTTASMIRKAGIALENFGSPFLVIDGPLSTKAGRNYYAALSDCP